MDIRTAIRNCHREFDSINLSDEEKYNEIEDRIVELETKMICFEDLLDSDFEICPVCKSEEIVNGSPQGTGGNYVTINCLCDYCNSEWGVNYYPINNSPQCCDIENIHTSGGDYEYCDSKMRTVKDTNNAQLFEIHSFNIHKYDVPKK